MGTVIGVRWWRELVFRRDQRRVVWRVGQREPGARRNAASVSFADGLREDGDAVTALHGADRVSGARSFPTSCAAGRWDGEAATTRKDR